MITAREFHDIGGTAVSDLTNSAKFPNSPDLVAYPTRFEWPTGPDDATPPPGDVRNNYAVQIAGYLYPPVTGPYVFYIASDDNGELYLSTDDDPSKKVLIANEPEWSPVRAFASTARRDTHLRDDGSLPNISKPVTLTAGKAYYIEARMKEGGGGDNLAVAWQKPGDAAPEDGALPIPGEFLSTIDRTNLGLPYVAGFQFGPDSVTWTIQAGQGASGAVNAASARLTVNGAAVPVTSSVNGGLTTFTANISPFFPAGSTNTAVFTVTDSASPANSVTSTKTFVIANYVTLTSAMKVTADTAKSGFSVLVTQVEGPERPNTIARTESQLAGQLRDADGNLLPNVADLSGAGADGRFVIEDVINWNQDAPGGAGNFTATSTPPREDQPIPGIPGTAGSTDNIAAEILTYLELPAGIITMGVNSDDGFRTSAGNVADYQRGVELGSFNGGRGASDTIFTFVVQEAGVYPFRTIWEEGGGGANIEWFSVTNGQKVLINDRAVAGAIKAYRAAAAGTAPTFVKSILPGLNAQQVTNNAPIEIVIQEGSKPVTQGSIQLTVNGSGVTPTITKAGNLTTIRYTPTTPYGPGSRVNVGLSYNDGTAQTLNYGFTAMVPRSVLSTPGTFFIEAEDFNYGGGQHKAESDTMPYTVHAYEGLTGTVGIDFNDPGTNENTSPVYRPELPVAMSIPGGGDIDANRGTFDVVANYKVGWNDAGDWYNYTRNFPTPDKAYNVYASMSSGGNDNAVQLDLVTAGAKTASQTLQKVGEFRGPASGGWDTFVLVPLRNESGNLATVTLGGEETVRLTVLPGSNEDLNYLAFVPSTAGPGPGDGPRFTSVRKTDTGGLTIEWTGGGTLQSAESVTGPWSPVAGASSPATVLATGNYRFFRVVR